MSTVTSGKATEFSARINRIEISATLAITMEAEQLRAAGNDLADFGAGEPHFSTPQHIKDAAIAAIQGDFTKYTAVGGTMELKDAVRARHKADFASDYARDEVMASTGGKHVLFNAFQVLVEHGDEVIIPVPYWVSFKDIVQYSGGTPVFVQCDESRGYELTAAMIEKAITPKTKVILLNSPSNPSGAVMAPDEMKAIIRLARERGIWVVSDECYVYLNYTGEYFSAGSMTDCKDNLVIAGSLSKTYAMTGWRMGYGLAPKSVIKAMQKLQSQSTSNPTSIVQKAAVAAMKGSQSCVAEMRRDYIHLRDNILDELATVPDVTCNRPDGAFYVYPNVGAYLGRGGVTTTSELSRRLLHEAHVVTVPGEAFGTENHLRFSYATSLKEIERGMERVRKFFKGL
jgi:aspartate aminotransferase